MTFLTCLELAYNYPDYILVSSDISTSGKYSSWCYRLEDNGEIRRALISTDYVFNTAEEAENEMREIIIECIETFSNGTWAKK